MALFLPENGVQPLSRTDIAALTEYHPSFIDTDGHRVIQIDDMRFRVDDLSVAGFIGNRWPTGRVYYEFNDNVSATNRQRFRDACNEWERAAHLVFIERTTEPNYIHVKDDLGNWSHVGMINGKQEMGIYSWTWRFIIAHEIAHALGAIHEQCRSDRDSYVVPKWDNIIPGKEHNFRLIPGATSYNDYDFSSIMHYHQYAFSKNNLPTIEAREGYEDQEQFMGNRLYLTYFDAEGMALHYGLHSIFLIRTPLIASGA
jgi:hypothetical protein